MYRSGRQCPSQLVNSSRQGTHVCHCHLVRRNRRDRSVCLCFRPGLCLLLYLPKETHNQVVFCVVVRLPGLFKLHLLVLGLSCNKVARLAVVSPLEGSGQQQDEEGNEDDPDDDGNDPPVLGTPRSTTTLAITIILLLGLPLSVAGLVLLGRRGVRGTNFAPRLGVVDVPALGRLLILRHGVTLILRPHGLLVLRHHVALSLANGGLDWQTLEEVQLSVWRTRVGGALTTLHLRKIILHPLRNGQIPIKELQKNARICL